MTRIAVLGAGGFIGHHLVKALKIQGNWVRGVDIKPPDFESSPADEFYIHDLRSRSEANSATQGVEEVFLLASNMGGMLWITYHDAEILYDNLMITVNSLEASRYNGARKILYTSSACVYPNYLQESPDIVPLKESDTYPADPQHGYGWEKLTGEKILTAYHEVGHIDVRIARLHAIYGPLGTWDGGREKAPAALSRKVAQAPDGGEVEIWGDGKQTRSFCYIDDCVSGLLKLMQSNFSRPLNIGSSQLTTMDNVADIMIAASGKTLAKKYVEGPQGVRGRNSDNTLIRDVLGWEPSITLENGMTSTYEWVRSQVEAANE
jgi:GDP-D-mannose 3', 5'-epimerase